MNPKRLRMNIYSRYVSVLAVLFFVSTVPVPMNKRGLLVCVGCALAGNAILHAVALATGRYRMVAYLLLGLDLAVILPAVYLTGFVASPFLIAFAVSIGLFYYLSMSRRATFIFGTGYIALFILAFTLWWRSKGAFPMWNPADYPAFVIALFVLQASIIARIIHQSTYLPEPLITELHRQETRMAEQRHRAELGGSLATVVQEIKNPLVSVRIAVESALRTVNRGGTGARERAAGLLRDAVLETGRLENRLAGISAYARENPVRLRRKPVAVRNLVNRAVDFIRMKHRGHDQVGLLVRVDRRISAACDPDAMHQVLVDLLDNAVQTRFPHRPIAIEVHAAVRDQAAVITVRDNGQGMLPDAVENLFRRSCAGHTGGTGLSLYLARRIMEAHGGRLEVSSTPGAGTTATAWLPLKTSKKLPTGML